MKPEKYYSIYFHDSDVNFIHEVEVVEHDNELGLLESDIKEFGNHFLTKPEADTARRGVINFLRLQDKQEVEDLKPAAPFRIIEDYILGKPNGFAFIDGLLILLAITVFLCAVWMVQSDSVLP